MKPQTFWQRLGRAVRDRSFIVGSILVTLFLLVAVLGPEVASHNPYMRDRVQTIDGKLYTIIAFLLTIVMVTTLIVDYILRRNEITSKGHHVRLSLDILVTTMIIGLALILWVTYDIMRLPYKNLPGQTVEIEQID